MTRVSFALMLATGAYLSAQTVEMVPVTEKRLAQTAEVAAEIAPYLSVEIHARVPGYVEKVLVDRGSVVKHGDLLAELSAPEMASRIAEAQSKVQAAEAEQSQAEAQVAALQGTLDRMKAAAQTPGAIAGNELAQLISQVDAAKALVGARQQAARAATAAVKALQELEGYLKITAPFDGMVTERKVHPGALVGGGTGDSLLTLQQTTRLRIIAAVPEENLAGTINGARVSFTVPAYPERVYSATVARSSQRVDQKTRTMAVELDAANPDGSLAPGMYAAVKWPVRRARNSLLVPKTSVVTTAERTFVIRNEGGKARWVDVRKGSADGDLLEVTGPLKVGDKVVRRATDEMRDGTTL